MAHSINMDNYALKIGETARITVFLDDTYSPVLQGTGVNVRPQGLDFEQVPGTVEYVTSETVAGGTNYIFTLTPTSNTQNANGNIRLNVPAAGDRPAIHLYKGYAADTQRPILASLHRFSPDCDLTAGDTATITFYFSEPVTGFTVDDLTIPSGKGTLSNLRAINSGSAWMVDLRAPATLPANTPEDVQITVNMAGITDTSGNAGTGSATLATYSLGNKPPSIVSVVGPTSIVTRDTQVIITFTFDEAVTGFTLANINLDNANASPYVYRTRDPVTTDGGRTWTLNCRANPGVTDSTNTVSIRNLDGVRDLAGNAAVPNSSASTDNYEVDSVDPSAISATFDKARLTAGETATVTITFNESVSNVTKTALEIPDGTVSDPTPVAGSDGRVWTATFTPTANLARTSSSIRINLDGIRDRAGNVASGAMPFYDSTIVIDTKVFVVNDATVNGKQLVLRYSDETMLDPDQAHNAPGDAFVVLVNGVRNDVTGVTVDAAAKTVTLTLERAVRKGQQVSVAYDDPSTGDDQQAVQEATTGKDAASFAAKPVTNLSPPPPPPPEPSRTTHWTPTTTVCPTSRRNWPPVCCAPMAQPDRMVTATAMVSRTASRSPLLQPATRPWWPAARTAN
nr:Ig-like domain-containing protein [Verminephrobacter eiseniae]